MNKKIYQYEALQWAWNVARNNDDEKTKDAIHTALDYLVHEFDMDFPEMIKQKLYFSDS